MGGIRSLIAGTVVVAGMAMALGGTTTSSPDVTDGGHWSLVSKDGSEGITMDAANTDLAVDEPSEPNPTENPKVNPTLVDFGQTASCFTLNLEGTHIADYPFHWNGKTQTISLLCGTDKYGYKHIANGHKADWVATQINAHDDTGNSWDDLMSFAILASLTSPNWISGPTNGKFCGDAAVEFYDKNGNPTYYQRVMTIWSDTNKTVITAYPIETGAPGCL